VDIGAFAVGIGWRAVRQQLWQSACPVAGMALANNRVLQADAAPIP